MPKRQRDETLSKFLRRRSKEICAMNACTEEQHNCDSHAYISADMQLINLCNPDFFQGHSRAYAAISLPWTGTQRELKEAVMEECFAELSDEGYEAQIEGQPKNKCPYFGEAARWWKDGWTEARDESLPTKQNEPTK